MALDRGPWCAPVLRIPALAFSFAYVLSACAGVGIVATADPLRKLNDAEYLFARENRPLPAERLIREAISIYEERDDPHGLANANREYGDLPKSPAVLSWEAVYVRDGFLDKSITFANRLAKASEHYTIALKYYRLAEQRELAAGQYDALTNLYFNMAWSNLALGARDEGCAETLLHILKLRKSGQSPIPWHWQNSASAAVTNAVKQPLCNAPEQGSPRPNARAHRLPTRP